MGEIDVLYRIGGVIHGVRAGFGSYGGVGGYANVVWTDATPAPRRGFQYGYAEMELAPPVKKGPPVGLAGRFYAGVGEEGLGSAPRPVCASAAPTAPTVARRARRAGDRVRLRPAARDAPDRRIPVGISVGVTDQPGSGDLGARLAVDLGWRALSWIQPTLRVSWQGRTAVHSGVGGGLGVVFDW